MLLPKRPLKDNAQYVTEPVKIAVTHHLTENHILIKFNKQCDFLVLPREAALRFADLIRDHALATLTSEVIKEEDIDGDAPK